MSLCTKSFLIKSLGLVSLLSCTIFGAASLAQPQDLKGQLGIHDPGTIAKCEGFYYTFGTGGGGLMSKDRVNWTSAPYNPTGLKQSWWDIHGGQIWASDATEKNGMYYCYYSVSAWMKFNSAVGLTTSPSLDPAKAKWTDQGIVVDSMQGAAGGEKVNVIDPSTVTDDDGRWFLCFGSFASGCRILELDPKTGKQINLTQKPIKTTHRGEGSAIAHWKTYFYYAVSRGTCCADMKSTYYIDYGRSTTGATGPYLTKSGEKLADHKYEPLLKGSNNPNATSGVVAVGVGGFFYDGRGNDNIDTLFFDYMGYTAPTGKAQLYIKPLYVDKDNWLTMDPSQGTVMTQQKKTTSTNGSLPVVTSTMRTRDNFSITAISAGQTNKILAKGLSLYSITGKKVAIANGGMIPAGVYIQKKVRALK